MSLIDLVLIAKNIYECSTSEMFEELEKVFNRLLNDKDSDVLEFGGEEPHVHILF